MREQAKSTCTRVTVWPGLPLTAYASRYHVATHESVKVLGSLHYSGKGGLVHTLYRRVYQFLAELINLDSTDGLFLCFCTSAFNTLRVLTQQLNPSLFFPGLRILLCDIAFLLCACTYMIPNGIKARPNPSTRTPSLSDPLQ